MSKTNIGGNNGGLAVVWRILEKDAVYGSAIHVEIEIRNNGKKDESVFLPGISLLPAFIGRKGSPQAPDQFGPLMIMGRKEIGDNRDIVVLAPGDYVGRSFVVGVPDDKLAEKLRLTIYYEAKKQLKGNALPLWIGRIGEVNSPELALVKAK